MPTEGLATIMLHVARLVESIGVELDGAVQVHVGTSNLVKCSQVVLEDKCRPSMLKSRTSSTFGKCYLSHV